MYHLESVSPYLPVYSLWVLTVLAGLDLAITFIISGVRKLPQLPPQPKETLHMVPTGKQWPLSIYYLEWMLEASGLFSGFLEEPLNPTWKCGEVNACGPSTHKEGYCIKIKTKQKLTRVGEQVKKLGTCGWLLGM